MNIQQCALSMLYPTTGHLPRNQDQNADDRRIETFGVNCPPPEASFPHNQIFLKLHSNAYALLFAPEWILSGSTFVSFFDLEMANKFLDCMVDVDDTRTAASRYPIRMFLLDPFPSCSPFPHIEARNFDICAIVFQNCRYVASATCSSQTSSVTPQHQTQSELPLVQALRLY